MLTCCVCLPCMLVESRSLHFICFMFTCVSHLCFHRHTYTATYQPCFSCTPCKPSILTCCVCLPCILVESRSLHLICFISACVSHLWLYRHTYHCYKPSLSMPCKPSMFPCCVCLPCMLVESRSLHLICFMSACSSPVSSLPYTCLASASCTVSIPAVSFRGLSVSPSRPSSNLVFLLSAALSPC